MNQPLGRVTLDAARAELASARLANEDFIANGVLWSVAVKDDGFAICYLRAFISFDRPPDLCSHGQIRQCTYWSQGSLMT
jgi:hypothetical protein